EAAATAGDQSDPAVELEHSSPPVVVGACDRELVGDHLAQLSGDLLEPVVQRARADGLRQLGVAPESQSLQPLSMSGRVLLAQAQLALDDREHVDRHLQVVAEASL